MHRAHRAPSIPILNAYHMPSQSGRLKAGHRGVPVATTNARAYRAALWAEVDTYPLGTQPRHSGVGGYLGRYARENGLEKGIYLWARVPSWR